MAKVINIADFKKRREAAGLTQPELAKAAGISNGAVSLIETGKRPTPRYATVISIDRALRQREGRAA